MSLKPTLLGLFLLLAQPAAAQLSFTEVTDESGATVTHAYKDDYGEPGSWPVVLRMAGGVAAGDYDRDGDVDLYVISGDATPNALLNNNGSGVFTDMAGAAGVGMGQDLGNGPVFADIDGDGWLDLVVGGMMGSGARVFRNRRDGTFEDVTGASGLVSESEDQNDFSTAFGDPDGDGDLDMVVAHWGVKSYTSHLWVNRGDGVFTPADDYAGISAPYEQSDWTFAPTLADIDGDRRQDLLMVGDFSTTQMFRNAGGLKFDNTTAEVIDDRNGMGSVVADLDNDGDMDWFVTSIWFGDGTPFEGNRLYVNDGQGQFTNGTDDAGVIAGDWGWSACAADFDNDGWLDLFHVNGMITDVDPIFNTDLSRLFLGDGDGSFTEAAQQVGIVERDQGRGLVCFDADNDGDIDIFTANAIGESYLYRNDLANNPGWLQVSLAGEANNPQAIGARIEVTIGGLTQTREVTVGSNYQSQNPLLQHFGLGGAGQADQVRVLWPHGGETVLEDVSPNQRITVSIAAAEPAPFSLEQAMTAAWYDPTHDGEGFIIEILPGGAVVLYWFTYNAEGEQDWYIAVGSITGRRVLFPELLRVSGGVFGPDFDPENISNEVVGSAAFTWNDCDSGFMDWQIGEGHIGEERGRQEFVRLTSILGLACGTDGLASGLAAQSGAWYDPSHDGEGIVLEVLSPEQAVAWWFSFGPDGARRWFFGLAERRDGNWEFDELLTSSGGVFGDDFDPEQVEMTPWGSLSLGLDCHDGGPADYSSLIEGFGSGRLDMVRLTQPDSTVCD